MTRKRVGQGLIEAFSTTCESCGGRGIHIHSEPVTKVALDKDMEQRYVPQVHEEETEVVDSVVAEEAVEIAVVAEVKAPAQKRRRRAVSTGVITPE
jgi:ribonuclease E